jgi:hypothetical protein
MPPSTRFATGLVPRQAQRWTASGMYAPERSKRGLKGLYQSPIGMPFSILLWVAAS